MPLADGTAKKPFVINIAITKQDTTTLRT
jgi:hypothetical protein